MLCMTWDYWARAKTEPQGLVPPASPSADVVKTELVNQDAQRMRHTEASAEGE